MKIHFSILAVILIAALIWERRIKWNKVYCIHNGERYDYKSELMPWLLVFGYMAYLAGMRTSYNDSGAYWRSFDLLEGTWDGFWRQVAKRNTKDWGFDAISILFKIFISDDYHAWFMMYGIVESIILIRICRRYAVSYLDACVYFFCSTMYINYFTMMRQWIAVVVLFAGVVYIREKKTIPYIILCVLMAQLHNSAYFMIVVYFIVRGEAWSRKQIAFIIAFPVGMLLLNPIMSGLESTAGSTSYDYVLDAMSSQSGSSPIRIAIAAVPVILAFVYRDRIEDGVMNVCVNMSLMNLLLTIMATFTSGLFIIRFTTYTSVYNMLLYPYLLNVALDRRTSSYVKPAYYIIYFLFYLYQMNYSPQAWNYGSDILGIY